jgi:DNA-binding MarR family transcriptional regulator
MDDREPLRAWLDLLSVTTAMRKAIDAKMKSQFGLSLSRFDVMAALARAGDAGLTGGALSAQLRVTDGNTTQVTAPLIEAGLVRRGGTPLDGRVAVFRLTRKGELTFEAMARENRAWVSTAFAEFTSGDLARLRQLLAMMQAPVTSNAEEAA